MEGPKKAQNSVGPILGVFRAFRAYLSCFPALRILLRRDFFFNPATGLNFSEVPKTFDLGIFKIHKSLDFVIFVLSKK